jgi:hypothetical protein
MSKTIKSWLFPGEIYMRYWEFLLYTLWMEKFKFEFLKDLTSL